MISVRGRVAQAHSPAYARLIIHFMVRTQLTSFHNSQPHSTALAHRECSMHTRLTGHAPLALAPRGLGRCVAVGRVLGAGFRKSGMRRLEKRCSKGHKR